MFLFRVNLVGAALLLLSATLVMSPIGVVTGAKSKAPAPHDDASADAGWSDLSASMEAMHRSMAAVRPSQDSNLNFVNLMLPHHQAAIEMAKTQLRYGNDPQMRRLAQEIITDQQSEIELMHLWLKQNHPAVLKPETK